MNKSINSYMILDLQFGSTGKGLLAGYLANLHHPDVVVTAWGPNAGHTYIDEGGRKYVHRMLANGVVSPALKRVLIGPGSVIDAQLLLSEVESCADLLAGKEIIIHPGAAMVLPSHVEIEERSMVGIGSTMKGTGEAMIDRIKRRPNHQSTVAWTFPTSVMHKIASMGVNITISSYAYRKAITTASVIQIEGAQGYSLSMYHGFYPYCTARDVTPAQVLADCAIPYGIKPKVYGTLRTFPIRVADRYDDKGTKIGTSGPCYDDQKELDWSEVGVEPELTTVTQLPRRVFSFSHMQLSEAVTQCGPAKLFLNFANYMNYNDLQSLIHRIGRETGIEIAWLGLGPRHEDITSLGLFPNLDKVKKLMEREQS